LYCFFLFPGGWSYFFWGFVFEGLSPQRGGGGPGDI
jgi:hypothetical protein